MRHLIDRAMTGDPDAFNALAAHIGDDMFAIARRILRDRERAADAVQATLLAIWRNLPKLRDPQRFDAWRYRLLVNECYRQGRRERRERDGRQLAPPAPPHPDHASAIADRDAIERAFLRLSPQHRAVVVLHHYRGLPLVDVAAALGIPAGTAYSRLHYAQERLRSVLTEEIEPVTSRGMA
jgi:RNA polymerase sigma-70 factor (ECF subfamily)